MRRALLLVCASAIAIGLTYADHAPLIPLIAADLGLDDVRSGLLSTAVFFTNLVTTFLALGLIDRLGPKRTVTLGLVAATVGTSLLAAAPVYGVMLLGKAAQGFGSAISFIAATRYLASLYGSRRSHFALGLYGAGFPLGSGLALLLMASLATALGGWRQAFATEATLVGLVTLAWSFGAPPVTYVQSQGDMRDALRCANCWLTSLQHAAGFGLALASGTWITVYLVREFTLPLALSGALGSGLLVLAVVGRIVGGWLVGREHVPTRGVMRAGEIAILVGVALLALPGRPLVIALIGAALVGIGVGLPYAAVFNTAAASLRNAPAAAQGLAGTGGTAGASLGAPVMGLAVQTYGFAAAWIFVGAVALLAFGGTFAIRGEEELA